MTLSVTMVRPAEEFGSVLTGRDDAARLREAIETELDRDGSVVVDFADVLVVSPSFADELFAKLPREAVEAGRVKFENLDEDLAALARFVFAGRASGATDPNV